MMGWREKEEERKGKKNIRRRVLERINKSKNYIETIVVWICCRLPWRRELKWLLPGVRKLRWSSPSVKAWVEILYDSFPLPAVRGRLPWRRELKSSIRRSCSFRCIVAFREGVSWNALVVASFLASAVAFREGVSWNNDYRIYDNAISGRYDGFKL